MIKKIRNIIIIFLILIFIILNKKFVPIKREITQIELIQTIGLDTAKNDTYRITTAQNTKTSSSKTSDSTSTSTSEQGGMQKMASIESFTFSDALKTLNGFSVKYVTMSHVDYFLIGENAAKTDLKTIIDFAMRNHESRVNARIYITKGMDSSEFLKSETNKDYDIEDRLESMENNSTIKSVIVPKDLLDGLNILLSDEKCGVIPALKIIAADSKKDVNGDSNDNINPTLSNKENSTIKSSINIGKEQENFFDYDGYGVIVGGKLVGYLNKKESIIYNMINNDFINGTMDIFLNDNNSMSFNIKKSNTNVSFNFDNDHLSQININTQLKTTIEEIDKESLMSDNNMLKKYEEKQKELIKSEIENLFSKITKYNSDFIGFNIKCKLQHPYKYEKIKDNWINELKNAKVNVNVDTQIRRSYDIVDIY